MPGWDQIYTLAAEYVLIQTPSFASVFSDYYTLRCDKSSPTNNAKPKYFKDLLDWTYPPHNSYFQGDLEVLLPTAQNFSYNTRIGCLCEFWKDDMHSTWQVYSWQWKIQGRPRFYLSWGVCSMIPANFFIKNRIQGKVIKCKHHPHLSIIIITCNWSLTWSWRYNNNSSPENWEIFIPTDQSYNKAKTYTWSQIVTKNREEKKHRRVED